ncbi:LysR family transcriptional regulator [Myxococcota bacterium]|nr:LysR family transcriptional regulator [Myxococcota bacterium]
MTPAVQAMTLDQLRLLVCVAEEGSFSAAGRRLNRAQSAVSYGISNLERLLGIQLFDRSGRRPVLTETGRGLLADAQQVLDAVGRMDARAQGAAGGLELEVNVAVDAICPPALIIALGKAFQERFSTVSLRLHSEVLAGIAGLVLDGTCRLGISGPVGSEGDGLERRFLAHLPMVPVASTGHALAGHPGPIPRARVRSEVQIVISQRAGATRSGDHGVLSATTWRVADAATKLALIRAGLGWGTLPLDLVREDLDQGRLTHLVLDHWGTDPLMAPLFAIMRADSPPGPAGRWLLAHLESMCQSCPELVAANEAED